MRCRLKLSLKTTEPPIKERVARCRLPFGHPTSEPCEMVFKEIDGVFKVYDAGGNNQKFVLHLKEPT